MNSCEVKTIGWSTKKRRSSEVAELPSATANLIYITLAKESPSRALESDEDFYNSFNEQETDICHDSSDISDSDTESQCSSISQHLLDDSGDTIATMEVVEYEVASATESDDDFSVGSSSGTDDFVLAAFAQAVADNSSASEFAILADTEESDDQTRDSDFAPADYWKCVKCNNKQNNPMYRYCERCYQVRKSLFPPRPKQKRKMRFKEIVKSDDLSDSGSSSSSSSSLVSNRSVSRLQLDSETLLEKKNIHGSTVGIFTSRTSDSDSETELPIARRVSSEELPDFSTVMSTGSSQNITGSKAIGCSRGNHKRRVQDELQDRENQCLKKRCEKLISEAPTEVNIKSLKLDAFKDSGFSSSSSQERSPTEEEKPLFEEGSSQEIYNANQDSEKLSKFLDIPSRYEIDPLKASSNYPMLSQISCISADSVLGNYKDEESFEYKSDRLRESHSSDFGAKLAYSESSLGVCMFCLSEPKNSVFVHSNFVHLCCCYKCAVKVWKQRKACPICNCKVKNVMKLFVH